MSSWSIRPEALKKKQIEAVARFRKNRKKNVRIVKNQKLKTQTHKKFRYAFGSKLILPEYLRRAQ